MKNILITTGYHGVEGAGVMTTERELLIFIKMIKRQYTKDMCKVYHKNLKKSLSEMLPDIMSKGYATDENGEHFDRAKFDDYLVFLAVCDHIGNKKPIARRAGNIDSATDTLQ